MEKVSRACCWFALLVLTGPIGLGVFIFFILKIVPNGPCLVERIMEFISSTPGWYLLHGMFLAGVTMIVLGRGVFKLELAISLLSFTFALFCARAYFTLFCGSLCYP